MRADCPLCAVPESPPLWQNASLRVIDAAEPALPGYTRVIWHDHQSEMTQLAPAERAQLMETVWIVERTLRSELAPDKINLAQLGNQVPHLHWHIIPRWTLDPYYPDAVWAPQRRAGWDVHAASLRDRLPAYHAALQQALKAAAP